MAKKKARTKVTVKKKATKSAKAKTVHKKAPKKKGKAVKKPRQSQSEKAIAKRKAFVESIADENRSADGTFAGGNKFWKLRSKHGRDAIFTDPKILLESCYEYFEHESKNKLLRIDYKGKDAYRVEIPTDIPFTIQGLCIFLGVDTEYFNDFKERLRKQEKTATVSEFSRIITHVMDIINKQKLDGAMCFAYHPNIVARVMGLKDSKEITVAEQPLFPEEETGKK